MKAVCVGEMISNEEVIIRTMYLDKPLQYYLDELASAKSTPGGGSAAALSGAMGAAPDVAWMQPEIEALLQQTEKLRERFQQLMQEDIDAYGRLSASFKMPRTTPEEVNARSKSIQAHLVEAALVPLEMAECGSSLVKCCCRIAEIGNVNVLSDVATGALLASSAGAGAAWMVRANLRAMKDLELVEVLSKRLSTALDEITEYSQQVTSIVGGRA